MSPSTTSGTPLKYRAFISYAHADASWGQWLHRRLETFRIERDLVGRETARGPVPAALRPIFRDRDEFTSGETLDAATIAALDQSECLIVLCSPVAAGRPAVENEVRQYRSRHPNRPVIPVIIDGTYPANFPPSLLHAVTSDGVLTEQPVTILGPDLRETGDGRSLGIAKIVAGMTGVGTDEIVRRGERQRRRVMRNWIAGLSTVAVAMAGLAGLAEINRRQAQANLDVAIDSAEAYSSQLAMQFKTIAGLPQAEVLELLQSAQRLTDRITSISANSDKHDESRARLNLTYAVTYKQLGRLDDALQAAENAKSIAEALSVRQPDNIDALRLAAIADTNIAELRGNDSAEEGVARARKYVDTYPDVLDLKRDLLVALNRLGDRYFDGGDASAALTQYREAQRIHDALISNPAVAQQPLVQSDRALALDRIGKAQLALGQQREALQSFSDGLRIMEHVAEQQPWNRQIVAQIAVSHEKIGSTMTAMRDLGAALKHHEMARDARLKLTRDDPDNVEVKASLLTSFSQIADVHYRLGQLEPARVADEASLALAREVVGKEGRAAPLHKRQLMVALNRVSAYRIGAGDFDGAKALRREALDIARALANSDRGQAQFQADLMAAIAILMPFAADADEVRALAGEAKSLKAITVSGVPGERLRASYIDVVRQAGTRAFVLRQFPAAEVYMRELVSLAPDDPANDAYLAGTLLFQDKVDEAERLYLAHTSATVEGQPWASWVAKGFADARAAGFDHPAMADIEAKLKATK